MHADFRALDAVVISHLHLDHLLDLLALRYALAYNPVPPRRPLPIWLPPGGLAYFGRLAAAIAGAGDDRVFFSVFELRQYDPAEHLDIGGLTLRFHPTVHYVPCWAARVSNGVDGDLFYTADTGPSADLVPFAAGSVVVVAEGTAGTESDEPVASRGHLRPSEAGALARRIGATRLILSHIWIESDPFAAVELAEKAFGRPVDLAVPGLRVRWGPTIERHGTRC
jgi:ribonuclease BN (tRNA processing enzyme)